MSPSALNHTESDPPTQIWIALEAIDMRIGVDGIATRVQETLGKSPTDGNAYVFRNRRNTRIKLLIWDSTGVWLCQRRLHRGSFAWPSLDNPVCEITPAQWEYLIKGVDWQRLHPLKKTAGAQNWAF